MTLGVIFNHGIYIPSIRLEPVQYPLVAVLLPFLLLQSVKQNFLRSIKSQYNSRLNNLFLSLSIQDKERKGVRCFQTPWLDPFGVETRQLQNRISPDQYDIASSSELGPL